MEEGQCESRSVEKPDLRDWSACMLELSLHILDVLENALAADANLVELIIEKDSAADLLTITVKDDGRGMDQAQLARIFDPFFTTRRTRHVGLGIPLFKAAAERCNGDLTIDSQLGKGTTLRATFQDSHIDRAPLGDITGTLMATILADRCDVHYVHRVDDKTFEFNTADIKAELEDIPLTHPAVRDWLQTFITDGENELRKLRN
jgi:hypothetical protein